jgi:protein-S-isoprenylcysteine O-methyltransferase Ste14
MKVADVDIIIGVVWIAFWIYWLASSFGVKTGRTPWARFAGVRLVIIAVVVVFLRGREFSWREHSVTHNWWLVGIGLALFLLGLGLAVWARLYLGRNWGMPMSKKDEPELVTTGPYHWVRNPIYSGLILATIGTALAISVYWLIATAVLGGYFVYSAIKEGSYLAEQFPDTYPAYKRSTKMLIPFVF